MRPGVRLGIDVGTTRVGVARSDPAGLLAVPLETVTRNAAALARIRALLEEHEAIELVVGLPLSLRGEETASTADARRFAESLAGAVSAPIRMVDERLSTVSAARSLREAGRSSRGSRPIIDQAAAVVILQAALDQERAGGSPPGSPVAPDGGP